jgi:hypothetical protein
MKKLVYSRKIVIAKAAYFCIIFHGKKERFMNKLIHYLYDFDKEDKTYVIRLSVPQYTALFNKFDYYPIKKREINDRVISYIEDCSTDIPLKAKIKIVITIKQEKDKDIEDRVRLGIYHNFLYLLDVYREQSKEVKKVSALYVVVFLLLTLASVWLESLHLPLNKIFFDTLLKGLSIGSWVFLWEAIASIVFRNSKNRYYIKIYKRLVLCKLCLSYENLES